MKKIIEGSENYTCTIVKLPVLQDVSGFDKLKTVSVFGNTALVSREEKEGELYCYFPAGCQLSHEVCFNNNLYRDVLKNKDTTKVGYIEDNRRVKAIKFRGVISSCLIISLDALAFTEEKLELGDEFNALGDTQICVKYKVPANQVSTKENEQKAGSRSKEKRFSKLVPNQFRFHGDTAHFLKHLNNFSLDDVISITSKFHGTSGVFANVLANKKLSWWENLLKKWGVKIVDKEYGDIYSSRKVVKNAYINPNAQHYYGVDIWGEWNEKLKPFIEQGITLYGEIVGFTSEGKEIQKKYDYKCAYQTSAFYVYRITYTKPNGETIEFSHNQIKNYCKKYSLSPVPEYFFGTIRELLFKHYSIINPEWYTQLEHVVITKFNLEKDCEFCAKAVPAEGLVIRKDGGEHANAYKIKAKRFVLGEEKELEKGETNIEDEN